MINLENLRLQLRKIVVQSLHATGGGHYGGALSVLDILLVLYTKVADWANPILSKKDRIILSKGHAAIGLYSVLSLMGIIPKENLKFYGKFNKNLEGHPDMISTPGLDFSSGSLGQGLSVGLGMAFGLPKYSHVWVVLGDGECQEGQIWEAAILASRYRISNLHVIIDLNNAQEFGYKNQPSMEQDPLPNAIEKWKSFGWVTEACDGHNLIELHNNLLKLKQVQNMPSVLIARTRKGSGVSLFEKDPEKFHCASLTDSEYNAVINELVETCNS